MRCQVVLSGLGGQGVLFATKIIALAAKEMGLSVLISETHGMAQRGGNVISHLKIFSQEQPFFSPLVRPGKADILLAFHREGLDVHGCFVRPGGRVVCNAPDGEPGILDEATVCFLDATGVAVRLGSPLLSNVVLLGFAASKGFLPGDPDLFRRVLKEAGGRRVEDNLRAFNAGVALAPGGTGC